jgi:hypothetical protein
MPLSLQSHIPKADESRIFQYLMNLFESLHTVKNNLLKMVCSSHGKISFSDLKNILKCCQFFLCINHYKKYKNFKSKLECCICDKSIYSQRFVGILDDKIDMLNIYDLKFSITYSKSWRKQNLFESLHTVKNNLLKIGLF